MSTLATLRDALRTELHDEDADSYRWPDETLDRHIERAVRELSQVWPVEQKTTLQTTPGSRDVSIADLDGLVRLEAVEYPVGAWPPAFVQFAAWAGTLTLLIDAPPSDAADIHVYWGGVHTLDLSSSTLPAIAEEVVLHGAAGYAALEWASFATNRANVSGTDAVRHYQEWGAGRLVLFTAELGKLGRNSRLRASSLYAPARPRPSQSVVTWDV
jgi:hypothetical protein